MSTKVLSTQVPAELADKVDAVANRLERSRGWVVKQALESWLDQEDQHHRLTMEAIADVDVGCVIDHAAVQAWADSLNTDKPLPLPK